MIQLGKAGPVEQGTGLFARTRAGQGKPDEAHRNHTVTVGHEIPDEFPVGAPPLLPLGRDHWQPSQSTSPAGSTANSGFS